jgi:sec-independent protein translocase protein TatA
MGFGFGEIVIILIVALLVFGAKRLPEIARSLGTSVNEFKQGLSETPPGPADNPRISAGPAESDNKGDSHNKGESDNKDSLGKQDNPDKKRGK